MQSGTILITKWGDRCHRVKQILQSEATLLLSGEGIRNWEIIITKNYKFMLLQNEVILTHFQTNVLLLYSLKTSENFRFSDFLTFSGDIEVENWLKMGLFCKMGQVIFCKMGRSLSQTGAGITK